MLSTEMKAFKNVYFTKHYFLPVIEHLNHFEDLNACMASPRL